MTRATRHPFLPWAFHLHGWRSCPAHSRGSEEPRPSTEYAEPSELVCTRPLGRPLRTSSSTAPVFSHRTSTPTEDALPCEPPFTAPVRPQEAKWCACRAWSAGLAVSILEGGQASVHSPRCSPPLPRGGSRPWSAVWFRSHPVVSVPVGLSRRSRSYLPGGDCSLPGSVSGLPAPCVPSPVRLVRGARRA